MKVLSCLFCLVFGALVMAEHFHSERFDIIAPMSVIFSIVVLVLLLRRIVMSKERADFRNAVKKLEKAAYTEKNSAEATTSLEAVTSLVKEKIGIYDQKTAQEFSDKISGVNWPQ